ncbi:glycosyltransferase [Polyangium sp. 6x1]|uniref:glycosyltransferase n=1 Tax=Polyangium sp. 6x1 TaxID=3042689 RepID=UPI002482972A|nr:glycosyltransferase [Polyangium sp. 6x1]MDI1446718.1 glycosyltransferase [Polyangium sp. 6x1]
MTEQALSAPDSPIELSVIVPCLDEELNLRELAARVLRVFEVGGFVGELVLVDDGSKDGTAAVIRELSAASEGRIVGGFHPENRGIAAAWRTGVGVSRGKLVATIDADLQYQPEDLLRLRRALYDHSVDVVQGFRSAVGRRKDQRYHLSRGLNHLLNGVFGMDLSDNKSGFVMCAREVMLDLLTYRGTYFYWQSFIMVAAHAKGYSYKEIETIFEQRRQGTSFLEKTAVRASVLSFVDIGKAAWEYRVSRPPQDVAHQFLRRHPVADRTPPRTPVQEMRWRAYLAAFDSTHWMITRDVEHYYETLCKTQWLGIAETRELQDEKLRRLVRHAYRNVPYYRARMQELGLRPEDVRGQADLHKLPLLTKADIRKHLYFDIMSENHDKSQVQRIATSGSTGEPFVCYADRVQLELRWAATLRAQEWTGYRFGDPCVRLWHQTIGMSKSQIRKERADAVLSQRTFVPVFEMSEKNLAAMVRTIAEAEPVLLDGYAEALDFLARYLRAHGNLSVRPRAVMSSAQTLPIPSRRVIEQAFGCAVFDKYGSREFSGIAYECEAHAGHHVVAEGYIVEILKGGEPAKPGEIGEVVITDLTNMCMPFIRYRIGDLAEAMDPLAPCTCGRGAPRIGAIEGRVQSIIQGTDGRFVPGTFFAHYLKEYDHAIKQFQVVQEELGAMTFRVVKGGRFSDDVLDEVLAKFREVLGDDLRIAVEFVDEVAMVRTGKRVAAVSKLGIDFQGSRASVRPSVDREANRA